MQHEMSAEDKYEGGEIQKRKGKDIWENYLIWTVR